MKSDAIFKKYLTAEHAEIAEIILIFFLSVLCELRGELLVSFSIWPAVFLAGGWAEPWTPEPLNIQTWTSEPWTPERSHR